MEKLFTRMNLAEILHLINQINRKINRAMKKLIIITGILLLAVAAFSQPNTRRPANNHKSEAIAERSQNRVKYDKRTVYNPGKTPPRKLETGRRQGTGHNSGNIRSNNQRIC